MVSGPAHRCWWGDLSVVSADFDLAGQRRRPRFLRRASLNLTRSKKWTGLSLHVCGNDNLFTLANNGGYSLLALHFVQYVRSRSS